MKPMILLMDDNRAFTTRVARRLAGLAGQAYQLSDQAAMEKEAALIIVPSSWKAGPLFQGPLASRPALFWDDPPPLRFAGARALDQAIRDRLGGKLGQEGPHQIGCHLSFSEARGQALTAYVIDQAMSRGKRLIYLPLKPLYKIRDSFRRGPEANLGDLLCQIDSGNPPPARDLGLWLYMHEKGYFTFRLPERAHDLTDCGADQLQQLIALIADHLARGPEPTLLWLDTQDLALEKLTPLAGLCHFVYVDVPQGSSSAASLARRELSLFLASLPPSCAILECPGEKEDRPDAPSARSHDHVAQL